MVGSGAALGYCWLSVGVVPNVRCQESGGAVELARSGTGMQQDAVEWRWRNIFHLVEHAVVGRRQIFFWLSGAKDLAGKCGLTVGFGWVSSFCCNQTDHRVCYRRGQISD